MYLVVFFAVGEMRDVGVNVSQALPTSISSSLFPLDASWGTGLGTSRGLGPVNSLILILSLLLTWLQYLEEEMDVNKVLWHISIFCCEFYGYVILLIDKINKIVLDSNVCLLFLV